jgi:geranylgeranyl reductase family protein
MPDVLVVGAGPAGSIAALALARAGVRVRLIDRAKFPRDKLCGDTVNPGSLALLDAVGLGNRIRTLGIPVRGMTVTGPNGSRVDADYPADVAGVALTRRLFDQTLVDAAIGAGAEFDDGITVLRPIASSRERVSGATVRGDGDRAVHATVVIAADGRASRLGSTLGLSRFAVRPRRWAFGAYFEGVAGLGNRGEMHVRTDGYLGIAPMADGIANVCVVRSVEEARPLQRESAPGASPYEDLIAEAVACDAHLRERFAKARRVSDVTVLGPLAVDANAAGVPGLLLAGDAAGFVDPMTGDGLRFALRGGQLAAEAAMREIETGVAQHGALADARRLEFAGKWRINRALRALVGSPAGVALAARMSRYSDRPIRSLVAIAGDVALAVGPGTGKRSVGATLL